ncbi:hypothetical protein [Leptospira yasudae]|uniref:hypothetical protein n=1 Tax=Leptospira yasudae TaxID=2202201 RepID=UPI0010913517|nr:hypothetical protein [Leptospira yasudae]MBW0432539.1 hypothetical protein [Leptospira yasudae]TGN01463.1 hypothetical protein EHR10_07505 [Leptospira yasudae]
MKSEPTRNSNELVIEILDAYRKTKDSIEFLSRILNAFDPEGYWQPNKKKPTTGEKIDLGLFLDREESKTVQADLERYLKSAESELDKEGPMSLLPLNTMLRDALQYENRFETKFLAHPGHVYGLLAQPFPLLKIARDCPLPVPGYPNITRQYEFWISLIPKYYGIAEIFLLERDFVITEIDEFLTANDWQYYFAVNEHNPNPPPSKYANEDFRDSIYSYLADVSIRLRIDEFFQLRELVQNKDMEGIRSLFKASFAYQRVMDSRSFEHFWNHKSMAFCTDLAAFWHS